MTNRLFVAKMPFAFLLAVLILAGGCKKEEKKNEVKFNDITATGEQEAPAPVNSAARATLNATFDRDAKTLAYTITFSGLNPIAMHFHQGAAGTAGPVVIDLKPATGVITSPAAGTSRALTAAEEADLLNGNWYLNLHSNAHPDGEIRGQLVAR
ncbi:MAG: CHRD domain-containing protein [Ferruginibacter sp.]|nr:CHRD domain-containing protein [Cytophagales bacterium]